MWRRHTRRARLSLGTERLNVLNIPAHEIGLRPAPLSPLVIIGMITTPEAAPGNTLTSSSKSRLMDARLLDLDGCNRRGAIPANLRPTFVAARVRLTPSNRLPSSAESSGMKTATRASTNQDAAAGRRQIQRRQQALAPGSRTRAAVAPERRSRARTRLAIPPAY